MGISIESMLPDGQAALALEPEELAAVLLVHLNSLPPSESHNLNYHNFFNDPSRRFAAYPEQVREPLAYAFAEAWAWLQREGLLVRQIGQHGDWFQISRRGKHLLTTSDVEAYRRGNVLPKGQLHPRLVKVWSNFLRGAYETAVFESFKEVEVAVREAGKYSANDLGVDLMRSAFGTTGRLTNIAAPKAEREAMAHLFAGAIGIFKNPHSHRNVPLKDVAEAVEMILLASLLLRIVDARRDGPAPD